MVQRSEKCNLMKIMTTSSTGATIGMSELKLHRRDHLDFIERGVWERKMIGDGEHQLNHNQ